MPSHRIAAMIRRPGNEVLEGSSSDEDKGAPKEGVRANNRENLRWKLISTTHEQVPSNANMLDNDDEDGFRKTVLL